MHKIIFDTVNGSIEWAIRFNYADGQWHATAKKDNTTIVTDGTTLDETFLATAKMVLENTENPFVVSFGPSRRPY